jgi:hypothetical protein
VRQDDRFHVAPATLHLLLAGCLAGTVLGASSQDVHRSFDEEKPGSTPAGFSFGSMRQPQPGRWLIRRAGSDTFLAHEPDESTGYALAIAPNQTPEHVSVSVRVRLAGGARTGGLVWRYLDDQHYYSLVLDVNAGSLALYRISGGHRIRLELEDDVDLDPGAWHVLKVVHTGSDMRAYLGGISVFDDEDRRPRWAASPNRVGVLATGNSEIHFDDLHVGEAVRKGGGR